MPRRCSSIPPAAKAGSRSRGSTRSGGWTPASRRSKRAARSEEHTSELQSLMRISYAVFCLKKKKSKKQIKKYNNTIKQKTKQNIHNKYRRKHTDQKVQLKTNKQ